MRRMKNFMAMLVLAAMATLGAQTTFAGTGIIITDHANEATNEDTDGSFLSVTGIIITDITKGIIMTG